MNAGSHLLVKSGRPKVKGSPCISFIIFNVLDIRTADCLEKLPQADQERFWYLKDVSRDGRVQKNSGGHVARIAVAPMHRFREEAPHPYPFLELSLESSLQYILGVAGCSPSPLGLGNKVWMERSVQTFSSASFLADQLFNTSLPDCLRAPWSHVHQ